MKVKATVPHLTMNKTRVVYSPKLRKWEKIKNYERQQFTFTTEMHAPDLLGIHIE